MAKNGNHCEGWLWRLVYCPTKADLSSIGSMLMKTHKETKWEKLYAVLRSPDLYFYDDSSYIEGKDEGVLSLYGCTVEGGFNNDFKRECIHLSGRGEDHYFYTNTPMDFMRWSDVLERVCKSLPSRAPDISGIFGAPLETTMKDNDPTQLPPIISLTLQHLQKHIYEEGLFRLSGRSSELKRLQNLFNQGMCCLCSSVACVGQKGMRLCSVT